MPGSQVLETVEAAVTVTVLVVAGAAWQSAFPRLLAGAGPRRRRAPGWPAPAAPPGTPPAGRRAAAPPARATAPAAPRFGRGPPPAPTTAGNARRADPTSRRP